MAVQKDINRKLVLSETQIDKAVQRIIDKKKRHKTKTFTMLIDGKEVTVVKYKILIDLDKLSPSTRRKVTKRYILNAFEGSAVKTIDGKVIAVKSTGGANKMHFQSKQSVSLFLDDLIKKATPIEYRNDYTDPRIKWLYYGSYIFFNGTIYQWLINIKEADGVFSFYDLNKRKEVDMSATSNR